MVQHCSHPNPAENGAGGHFDLIWGSPPDHWGDPPDHWGSPPDHWGDPPDHWGDPPDHWGDPPNHWGNPPNDQNRENPEFVPANFNAAAFQKSINSLDNYRQLHWVLEKFLQAVNEAMLIQGDASFRSALFVYRNLQAQARARVHGAEPLFRALLRFFRRRRPAEELEETDPTMKQLERDFNKMIHGKADGEIILKNEKPRKVGGARQVIDNVRTGRAVIKESVQEEIET